MKKIAIFLLFLVLSGCGNDPETTERLNFLTQEQVDDSEINKSFQSAFGCDVAQIAQSGSNQNFDANSPTPNCERKVKDNGSVLIGVTAIHITQIIMTLLVGAAVFLIILTIMDYLIEQNRQKHLMYSAAMSILTVLILSLPVYSVKTQGIEYKVSVFFIMSVKAISAVSDQTITSTEQMLTATTVAFPPVKLPLENGNTANFETLSSFIILSGSRTEKPITFKFYKENGRIIGYAYAKDMKATVSMAYDEKAIGIGKEGKFKDIEEYQIKEIQNAFQKSFEYTAKASTVAVEGYRNTDLLFSNKTFDMQDVFATGLTCDEYLTIPDLEDYSQTSIKTAYRKLTSACASQILSKAITGDIDKSADLRNNYAEFCSSSIEGTKARLNFNQAKDKAKSCAVQSCNQSAFLCSVGLNLYSVFNEKLEEDIKSNKISKALLLFFMESRLSNIQETANQYLNSFNVDYEIIEDENVVETDKEPIFTIQLSADTRLNFRSYNTEQGFFERLYTEIVGFDVSMPSIDDVLGLFNFGESGRFGLVEAATCLKYQSQIKDGYSCQSWPQTAQKYFLRLFSNGIDGKMIKIAVSSQNKAVKNNLNAEIKQEATNLGSQLGNVAKLGLYVLGISTDKNLYGEYTKDLTLKSDQGVVYFAMLFSNQQIINFLDKFFNLEIVVGLTGYFLIPSILIAYFLSQQIAMWTNLIPTLLLQGLHASKSLLQKQHNELGLADPLKTIFICLVYLALIPLSFAMAYVFVGALLSTIPPITDIVEMSIFFEPVDIVSQFVYDLTVLALFTAYLFIIVIFGLAPVYITTQIATFIVFRTVGYFHQEENIHKDFDDYWSKK
ncbi:TPA: hypothetical protein N0H21_001326 [Pseudomonas aeruginosa]|nr:hypothetical protein [Pseudomonas aeruginosa]